MFKKRIQNILNHHYSLYFLLFLSVLFISLMGFAEGSYSKMEQALWIPVTVKSTADEIILPEHISFRSLQNPVLIWDFNQWEEVALQNIDNRLIKDDPRRQDVFEPYKKIFYTADGSTRIFVEQQQSSFLFYKTLRNADLEPLVPLISKDRWTFILLLLFFPLIALLKAFNRWEKISLLVLWFPLCLWGDPFSPLLLLWAILLSVLKERKSRPEKIIYWSFTFSFLVLFGFMGTSLWILLLCLNHLAIVSFSPAGGLLRDHPLLEPVLLLKRHRFTPRTSLSGQDKRFTTLFVSLLFLVSVLSSGILGKNSESIPDNALNYIPDEETVLNHLSFQKSLSYLRKEEWPHYRGEEISVSEVKGNFKEGIIDQSVLPSSSEKEYWYRNLPENSLESWVLGLGTEPLSMSVNKIPWQVLFILSVISWLTILIGLWQSNIDFDSQSYFVFKMKRRLKVA